MQPSASRICIKLNCTEESFPSRRYFKCLFCYICLFIVIFKANKFSNRKKNIVILNTCQYFRQREITNKVISGNATQTTSRKNLTKRRIKKNQRIQRMIVIMNRRRRIRSLKMRMKKRHRTMVNIKHEVGWFKKTIFKNFVIKFKYFKLNFELNNILI